MRLDKYLKVSRIIKRRTVANEACDAGRVSLNGKIAKAGAEVKVGDVMEIRLGDRVSRYEVVSISEHAPKNEAADMYRTLQPGAGSGRCWGPQEAESGWALEKTRFWNSFAAKPFWKEAFAPFQGLRTGSAW